MHAIHVFYSWQEKLSWTDAFAWLCALGGMAWVVWLFFQVYGRKPK